MFLAALPQSLCVLCKEARQKDSGGQPLTSLTQTFQRRYQTQLRESSSTVNTKSDLVSISWQTAARSHQWTQRPPLWSAGRGPSTWFTRTWRRQTGQGADWLNINYVNYDYCKCNVKEDKHFLSALRVGFVYSGSCFLFFCEALWVTCFVWKVLYK